MLQGKPSEVLSCKRQGNAECFSILSIVLTRENLVLNREGVPLGEKNVIFFVKITGEKGKTKSLYEDYCRGKLKWHFMDFILNFLGLLLFSLP